MPADQQYLPGFWCGVARGFVQGPHMAYSSASDVKSRLLPKEIFREPFGLPKIKVGSPSHNFRSPELITDY